MPRPATVVKRVDADLHPAVVDLWTALRVESGSSPESAARLVADGAVSAALDRPDVGAYVAVSDCRPMGYVVLSERPSTPFTEGGCVTIEQLYVAKDARHLGIAKALLAAVAAHAERTGSDQVASTVPAGGRDANRFFARLGFSPITIRRVASTTILHRRLAHEPGSSHSREHLLARRRSARLRAAQQQGLRA
ncbi:MAG: GNAT family N-acetyltransferase [Dermatophilaceae bacterium]